MGSAHELLCEPPRQMCSLLGLAPVTVVPRFHRLKVQFRKNFRKL